MKADSRIFVFGGLRDGQFLESSLQGLEVHNYLLKNLGLIASSIMFSNQNLEKPAANPNSKPALETSIKQTAKKGGGLFPGLTLNLQALTAEPSGSPPATQGSKSSPFVSFKPLPDSFIQKKILRKMTSRYNNLA